MTDAERTPDPVTAINRLPEGAGVIFRHYGVPNRKEIARTLVPVCRHRRITLLIAEDWRLAAEINADGVHLPEHIVPTWRGGGNKIGRNNFMVTAAAHSQRSLWNAARAGVDAVLVSPVFPTVSHPENRPLGITQFSNMCRISPVPVYALGGITQDKLTRLQNSGCVGVAGIGLFYP
ncbi:MAG: thiamine phosphate synthase [Rhodospirillales bacterium]|jgi:thiamine-phosphate pyrophosphorylase|nr:thiamine phosphate synthase [Rhodospirillales bacterium]